MAQTKTDLEREALVEKVGRYFLKTGDSTRNIGKIFNISNATVSDYINRYGQLHPKYLDQIADLRKNNLPSTIKDLEIKTRVISSAKLCLKGHTAFQIANSWGVTEGVIRNDLNLRMPNLISILSDDEIEENFHLKREEVLGKIKDQLSENSKNNSPMRSKK